MGFLYVRELFFTSQFPRAFFSLNKISSVSRNPFTIFSRPPAHANKCISCSEFQGFIAEVL